MSSRREFLKKAGLTGILGAGSSLVFADMMNIIPDNACLAHGNILRIKTIAPGNFFLPLHKIEVDAGTSGSIDVLDGSGRRYYTAPASGTVEFTPGGTLGTHYIVLKDKKGAMKDLAAFRLGCQTHITDDSGEFSRIADMLYYEMCHSGYDMVRVVRLNGKMYHYFSSWFQDHMYAMQGQKYFYPELKSGIDLYFDGQRADGMFHDNFKHRNEKNGAWSRRFDYGNFVTVPDDEQATAIFVRVPLENIAEFSMIEGTYFTWKATGDSQWMKEKLDGLLRAVKYATTDPYRWSEKFQLIKKGYAIDIWDFQNDYDAALVGYDSMRIELGKTPFGIMYADNVRMAFSCQLLAEMLEFQARVEEAQAMRNLGRELRERIDKLAWNGEFYTHRIPEDPTRVYDFGVDEKSQVTISNAYHLNHGATHEQAVSIIKTYQRIRREMPGTSPGEWYCCYPPFKKGWGNHKEWTYMNGGVSPITAGQLAKGALEHGFEIYGVDILRRVNDLVQKEGGRLLGGYRGAFPEAPVRNFEPISLKPIANADFSGTGAPGVPGWTGEDDNDLHAFPSGNQTFEGIPFEILNPDANGRRACLVLSGQEGYISASEIKISRKAASVYFVTASSQAVFPGYLTLHYADKTTHTLAITTDLAGSWWNPELPPSDNPRSKVAWRGANNHNNNVGVYVSGIDNPKPDTTIERIEFSGPLDYGKWMILGLTLCDTPVFFMPSHKNTIPAHWAAAECYYALMEGLAGVTDTGVAFSRARLAPRWLFAGKSRVGVAAHYPASGGYVAYEMNQGEQSVSVRFTGSGDSFELQIPLPEGKMPMRVTLNGQPVAFEKQTIESSVYVVVNEKVVGAGSLHVEWS